MTDLFRIHLPGIMCIYCGEYANSIEHFPPRSFTNYGWILPACLECNSLISTDYPIDFTKRCQLLKNRLSKKYKKLLKIPVWSTEELCEMSYTLQQDIIKWQRASEKEKRRIAWSVENYLLLIDRTKNFAPLFVESNFIEILNEQESVIMTQKMESSKDNNQELTLLREKYLSLKKKLKRFNSENKSNEEWDLLIEDINDLKRKVLELNINATHF